MRFRRSTSAAVIESSAGSTGLSGSHDGADSSSVNAITCLAAQNVSSGIRFANGGTCSAVVHVNGSNVAPSNAPTSRNPGYLAFIHAGVEMPRVAMLRPMALGAGNDGLVAFPCQLRPAVDTAAKRPGEVNEVVPDRSTVHGWKQGCPEWRPREAALVQPRRKHEQAPQIATMLVKDRVVGVVASSSEQLMGQAAIDDPPAGASRPRDRSHSAPVERDGETRRCLAAIRARAAPRARYGCPSTLASSWKARTGRGSSRARGSRARGESATSRFGAGCQPFVTHRVEAQQVERVLRVRDEHARVEAERF